MALHPISRLQPPSSWLFETIQFLEVRMISSIQWHTLSQAQEFSVCEYQEFLTQTLPKLKT